MSNDVITRPQYSTPVKPGQFYSGILPRHKVGNLPAAYQKFDKFGVVSTVGDNPIFGGSGTPVPTVAQWSWEAVTFPNGNSWPQAVAFGTGYQTKSGLQISDLQNFVGVPTVIQGNPPTPLSDQQLLGILRQAEDWVETTGGVMLTPTWIASPPATSYQEVEAIGLVTTSPPQSGQILGVDYDYLDIGYDFVYRKYLFESWGNLQLRWKPLIDVQYLAYIYPLLSEFFNIPLSWVVEDHDYGMIRLVPAANVEMLPLFAMQLAFMGFAQSLPQAIWLQYTAGLTPVDYQTRFSFIPTLILSAAACILLPILQGSINMGATSRQIGVDGLVQAVKWPSSGAAFAGLIQTFMAQRNDLMNNTLIPLVRGGPTFTVL